MKDEWKIEGLLRDLRAVEIRALWRDLAGFSCPDRMWKAAKQQMTKGETLDSADILR